jgi:hypothetical protein
VEVAAKPADPAVERVDVRILETRQEQPTVEVDHPGPRPDRWLDLAPVADSNDPSVPHRDGVRPRMFRIDRVNVAAA